jgi:hypothetical protein
MGAPQWAPFLAIPLHHNLRLSIVFITRMTPKLAAKPEAAAAGEDRLQPRRQKDGRSPMAITGAFHERHPAID